MTARLLKTRQGAGHKRHVDAAPCAFSQHGPEILDTVVERERRGASVFTLEQLDQRRAAHLEHICASGGVGQQVDHAARIEAQWAAERERLAERLPIDHQGQIDREFHRGARADGPAMFNAPTQLIEQRHRPRHAPIRTLSLPRPAGPAVPPPGHPKKAAPFPRTSPATSLSTGGGTVLISTNSLSLMWPARSPAGPPYTASMAASSVRIVMMVSATPASAAGLGATRTPAASRLHLSAERFHTVTVLPVSISRSAIAVPIFPTPPTPPF